MKEDVPNVDKIKLYIMKVRIKKPNIPTITYA